MSMLLYTQMVLFHTIVMRITTPSIQVSSVLFNHLMQIMQHLTLSTDSVCKMPETCTVPIYS